MAESAVVARGASRRGTYTSHRERQRRRILDAAGKLFDERGIDGVSIADIVKAAGIRPSTLYEYFSNREDIVWTIVEELFSDAAEGAKQAMNSARTALAKISALLEFMADQLTHAAPRVRFMAQFDAMYALRGPTERLLSLEAQISPKGFECLGALIREGIADGSLRADLDPELTMHAIMNAVIGAQRRLASLGSRVEAEYGHPVDRLFRETLRVILLGLRATGPALATHRRTRPQAPKRRKKP